jgi:hypothetical protein
MKRKKLYHKDWELMNKQERHQYSTSLGVISRMKSKKESLKQASEHYHISPPTVIKSVRPALRKKHGRWVVQRDHLTRPPMQIISEGKLKTLVVDDSIVASDIGEYFHAIDMLTNQGDPYLLKKFEGKLARDKGGNLYPYETDTDTIIEVLEKIREPDYPEPYK